jgi:hypothetical protein
MKVRPRLIAEVYCMVKSKFFKYVFVSKGGRDRREMDNEEGLDCVRSKQKHNCNIIVAWTLGNKNNVRNSERFEIMLVYNSMSNRCWKGE